MATPIKNPTWAFASDSDDEADDHELDERPPPVSGGTTAQAMGDHAGDISDELMAAAEPSPPLLPSVIRNETPPSVQLPPQTSTPKVTLRIPSHLASMPSSPMRIPPSSPLPSDTFPKVGEPIAGPSRGTIPKQKSKPKGKKASLAAEGQASEADGTGSTGPTSKGGKGKKASAVKVYDPHEEVVAAGARTIKTKGTGRGKKVTPGLSGSTHVGAGTGPGADDMLVDDIKPPIPSSMAKPLGPPTSSTPLILPLLAPRPISADPPFAHGPLKDRGPGWRTGTPVSVGSGVGKEKKESGGNGGYGASGGGGGPGSGSMHHVMRKEDGEFLSREDVQYDLLRAIFDNPIEAFTVPILNPPCPRPRPPPSSTTATSSSPSDSSTKMTFQQLYCYTISSSPRVTRQIKECLLDLQPGELPGKAKAGAGAASIVAKKKAAAALALASGSGGGVEEKVDTDELAPEGEDADDFDGLKEGYSRMCLLINFSRINTTYAFYPEMKTILRAYHSIPVFQKTHATRKGLQDAPRLKNGMKSVKLKVEGEHAPESLAEISQAMALGRSPATTICNLIFAMPLGLETIHERFPQFQTAGTDFLSLWTPLRIASSERARAILFVIYHYLESSTTSNPFAEEGNPSGFSLTPLSPEDYQALGENRDEEEELLWGDQMRANRQGFINTLPSGGGGPKMAKAEGAGDESQNENEPNAAVEKPRRVRGKNKIQKTDTAIPSLPQSKKRKRVGEMVVSMPRYDHFDGMSDGGELEDRGSMHARHEHQHQGISYSPGREWVARVDTQGIDDGTLERLVEQVELQIGPPPPLPPQLDWRDWEAKFLAEQAYADAGRTLHENRSSVRTEHGSRSHRLHPSGGDAPVASSPPPPRGLRALLN